MRRLTFLAAFGLALLSPVLTFAADQTIAIDNFVFTPKQLTVPAGTKVIWINRDDIPHTIVATGGTQNFRSPPLDTNDQFAMNFDTPGTYKYFCSIHPMMTGTIVVR